MNNSEQSKALDTKELLQFLNARMRMSHIYQPLLIRAILQNGGQATVREIASEFLVRDEISLKGGCLG